MANYNKVILMGNLTRDPELRHLPSNTAVVNFGLAVNRQWRNQDGEQQEETTFVDCECFGRQGEVINQYMQKGRPLLVEGRLKLDQWQDREGNNRSKHKVVVERFTFVGGRGDEQGGGSGRSAAAGADAGPAGGDGGGHQAVDDDDIPF